MKRLLRMLTGKCPHDNWSWPLRYTDGKDYQTCTDCGAQRESLVQFGKAA